MWFRHKKALPPGCLELALTRDSVCAADDTEDHTRRFVLPRAVTCRELLELAREQALLPEYGIAWVMEVEFFQPAAVWYWQQGRCFYPAGPDTPLQALTGQPLRQVLFRHINTPEERLAPMAGSPAQGEERLYCQQLRARG